MILPRKTELVPAIWAGLVPCAMTGFALTTAQVNVMDVVITEPVIAYSQELERIAR